MLGRGLHPVKARLHGQFRKLILSDRRGPLQTGDAVAVGGLTRCAGRRQSLVGRDGIVPGGSGGRGTPCLRRSVAAPGQPAAKEQRRRLGDRRRQSGGHLDIARPHTRMSSKAATSPRPAMQLALQALGLTPFCQASLPRPAWPPRHPKVPLTIWSLPRANFS